jgi:ribonuclease HI
MATYVDDHIILFTRNSPADISASPSARPTAPTSTPTAPPAPELIGIHKNPGPLPDQSPIRASTRVRTASHHLLNLTENALSPLSPLRRMTTLRHSLGQAAAPPVTEAPPPIDVSNLSSQDAAHIACQSFINIIQAEYPPPPPPIAVQDYSLEADEAALRQRYAPAAAPTRRQSLFPLGLTRAVPLGPALPPYLSFNLDAAFFTGGGSNLGKGSWAVVGRSADGMEILSGPLDSSTNNLAELTAILKALCFARKKRRVRILIATDSELAANFLKGTSRIDAANLYDVTAAIIACIPFFQAIFVSHVPAHRNFSWENSVADALCTWTLASSHSIEQLHLNKNISNLIPLLNTINARIPPAPPSVTFCSCCLKLNDHTVTSCPLTAFTSGFPLRQTHPPCLACLACDHPVTSCPLMSSPKRTPCPSLIIAEAHVDIDALGPMANLLLIDFSALRFPQKQSHMQFLDYWTTIFTKLLQAPSVLEAEAACRAAEAWSLHYHIDGLAIRQRKIPCSSAQNNEGSNAQPTP